MSLPSAPGASTTDLTSTAPAPPPAVSRGPSLAAAGLLGVALGALVYRYAVLPFAWNSSFSPVFIGLAVGGVMSARLLIKDRSPRWPSRGLAVLMGLAAVAATMGVAFLLAPPLGHTKLAVRELPGLSIALPVGDASNESLAYDTGSVEYDHVGGSRSVIKVIWEPGTMLNQDELDVVGRALASGLGGDGPAKTILMPGPGGTPVKTVFMHIDGGSMWLSMLPCGSRRVMVASYGDPAIESVQRRMLSSVQCRPDPAREGQVGTIPVVVDLPGWGRTDDEPGQLELSDGHSIALIKPMDPGFTEEDVGKTVSVMFAGLGEDVTAGRASGGVTPLHGTLEGTEVVGFARILECPGANALLMALSPGQEQADQVAAEMQSARCLRPGEAPQSWPRASEGGPAPAAPDAGPAPSQAR